MILAAGLGTRMAPLTQLHPKPVLPVLGEPMLLGMIRELARQGVERVVVNAHAFPKQIEDCVAASPIPVDVSEEPTLLGSAGGIYAVRKLLVSSDPFLVLNADMRIDFDLETLHAEHCQSGALATLLLRDDARKTEFGTIGYTSTGAMCRITDRACIANESNSGLFTGVQIMEPSIFDYFPQGGVSLLMRDVYVPLLRGGHPLGTQLQDDSREWWPIGTPRELLDVNLRVLADMECEAVHTDSRSRVEGTIHGPAWIDADVYVPASTEIGPNVVVGARTEIPEDFRARDSVFLADSRPRAGARIERAIAFGREVWRDA